MIPAFSLNLRSLSPALFAVLVFLHSGLVCAEIPLSPDASLGEILKKLTVQLKENARKRPFKLKIMNDSLDKTARAVEMMEKSRETASAAKLLETAHREYSENHYALLLQGVLAGSRGQTAQELSIFKQFLIASSLYTHFDQTFLTLAEFHKLRKILSDFLTAHGVSLKNLEKTLELKLPMQAFLRYLLNPGPRDSALAALFVFLLILETLFLLLSHFWGFDFSQMLPRAFIVLYLNTWIAYALWLVDLVAGLPWGLNRFQAIPYSFLILFLGFILFEWIHRLRELHRPLAEGFRRCPFCKKPIPKVLIECSECRRKLEE